MNYKNNPGNLRFLKKNTWVGQVEPQNGFCQFESMAMGFRAMVKTLVSYRMHGVMTLEGIIERYAPKSDGNNTQAYLEHVVERLNVFKEWSPQDRVSYIRLALAMVEVEQSPEGLNEFQRWAKALSMQALVKIAFDG